ncbi:MAG: penicillin-binding protein 2 [Elusimicrobiota bacterium]|jgi:cell division protein FtsI (penicillin-binding protein 3)|nr:penicillin-binding protein 2 [Elusimicrobiota bacterium]
MKKVRTTTRIIYKNSAEYEFKRPPLFTDRTSIVKWCVIVLFAGLFARLIYIQCFLHTKISPIVDRMVERERVETSKRGGIFDTKNKPLALSVKRHNIFLDAKEIKDFDEVKKALSKNGIKIKETKLSQLKGKRYVPLNQEVTNIEQIRNENLKGVGDEFRYVRKYPEGRLLAQTIGITSVSGSGIGGIEKSFDRYLRGKVVKVKAYKKAVGISIPEEFINKTKLRASDVILHVDKRMQFIVEEELREAFIKNGARKAMCVVQNPKTGAILAIASFPDFDFLDKKKQIENLKNPIISDYYEPGSTFKIIAAAAALEEKKVGLDDMFYLENGRYKIGNSAIKDDHKFKGSMNVAKIIEQSSNIGIAKVAQKLGKEKLYEYIRKFGFYSFTDIDLPGEIRGNLPEVSSWDNLSLANIAFGQGVGVTALQLINAFCVIANDGVLMKPSIIKSIENPYDKSGNKTFEPKEVRRVISAETAKTMRTFLKNAVEFGTGRSAKTSGWTAGGKTGTAQKFDVKEKKYSDKYYVASFCGMLPALEPKIVILVIIDEPKGNYYATSAASPVFSKIAERLSMYLEIPRDITENENDGKNEIA